MNNIFFKIIVSNYNNMPYVKKCLDSILAQTFQDFMIIVIDDQSSDLSYKFCEMYARKYPTKIRCESVKTKGYAGACRNIGLNVESPAEYIYFLDSDDWLYDNKSLENLYLTIIQNSMPDLIRCQYEERISDDQYVSRYISTDININSLAMLSAGSSCNCIKVSSLGHIRFQEKLYRNNDVIWFLNVCEHVTTFAVTQSMIFTYNRLNPISCQNSTTNRELQIAADIQTLDTLRNISFSHDAVNRRRDQYIQEITNRLNALQCTYKHINVTEFFNNAFVISFNTNNTNLMKQLFDIHHLSMPKIFPASHNSDLTGPYNCLLSHVSIVRMAKALDLPFVVIFEDDAYPCDNVYIKLEEVLKYIPTYVNILLLGWASEARPYGLQKFDQIYNKITRIIGGSHAYVIFKSGYDEYLNKYQENSQQTADGIFSTIKDSYIINSPLFIQFSQNISMNKHCGYIYYGDHDVPPNEFSVIETYIK